MSPNAYRYAAVTMMVTGMAVTVVCVTLAATGSLPEWGRATIMTAGVVMLIIGKLAYINARQAESRVRTDVHLVQLIDLNRLIVDAIADINRKLNRIWGRLAETHSVAIAARDLAHNTQFAIDDQKTELVEVSARQLDMERDLAAIGIWRREVSEVMEHQKNGNVIRLRPHDVDER